MTWMSTIETVTLFVDDVAGASAFYRDVLEARQIYADDESTVFTIGELQLNLLDRRAAPELVSPARVAESATDVGFVLTVPVGDVDTVAQQLDELGVSLLNGPVDRPWGVRTASFRDVAGYVWEVAAPLAPAEAAAT